MRLASPLAAKGWAFIAVVPGVVTADGVFLCAPLSGLSYIVLGAYVAGWLCSVQASCLFGMAGKYV